MLAGIDPAAFLAFLAASTLLILLPGPNVLFMTSRAAADGFRAGMVTWSGICLFGAAQIGLVVFGLSALIALFSGAVTVLKWAGAAYLIWLGVTKLRAKPGKARPPVSARRAFWEGGLVSLTNPKTMAFHAAFLPQFVSPDAGPANLQLLILAGSFVAIAAVIDIGYTAAAAIGGRMVRPGAGSWLERASGGILIGAGLWLAGNRS